MRFEHHNIGAILLDLAQQAPDAISVEQQGQYYTRGQIMGAAQALAAFFANHGVGAKDAVALMPGDPLRGIEAMIALWSLGAVVLFLDPRQPPDEVLRTLERAKVDQLFTDLPSFARKGVGHLLPARNMAGGLPEAFHFPVGSQDTDAFILSSSGTTDVPRFRRVSHQVFLTNLEVGGRIIGTSDPLPAVLLGSLAFGAKLSHWIRLLIHGCFILSLPLFSRIEDLHTALMRPDIKAVGLPPVLIRDLLAFHDQHPNSGSLPRYPNIQRLTSLGGPISAQDLVQTFKTLTPGVRNLYSMTGVGAVSVLSGSDILNKPDSVGKPLPEITLRIEDAHGQEMPVGQIGRIIATADWKPDARPINTGDMGWLDADGFLYVTGRDMQMATRNAVNVNLGDLEQDVKQLADVRDCTAFSLRNQTTPDDLIFLAVESLLPPDAIRNELRRALAASRRPDRILVRAELPRNASNKIALRELRTHAETEGGAFVDF